MLHRATAASVGPAHRRQTTTGERHKILLWETRVAGIDQPAHRPSLSPIPEPVAVLDALLPARLCAARLLTGYRRVFPIAARSAIRPRVREPASPRHLAFPLQAICCDCSAPAPIPPRQRTSLLHNAVQLSMRFRDQLCAPSRSLPGALHRLHSSRAHTPPRHLARGACGGFLLVAGPDPVACARNRTVTYPRPPHLRRSGPFPPFPSAVTLLRLRERPVALGAGSRVFINDITTHKRPA